MRRLIDLIFRATLSREPPGWGRIYSLFVGDYRANEYWKGYPLRLIRDKRDSLYRILNVEEWADRQFYFVGRWYDLAAALLIEELLRPGDTVVDVGANYGHFSLAAAVQVGSSGEIHAFEPAPRAFARLQSHVSLNDLSQIRCYRIGLGAKRDRLTISVPRINSGEATMGDTRYSDVDRFDVEVDTLENRLANTSVDFLKIDVEGFELNVLRGALGILERDRPLVLTEVIERHLASAGHEVAEVAHLMRGLGYLPFRLGYAGPRRRHRLTLESRDDPLADGDYLWVAAGEEARVAAFFAN